HRPAPLANPVEHIQRKRQEFVRICQIQAPRLKAVLCKQLRPIHLHYIIEWNALQDKMVKKTKTCVQRNKTGGNMRFAGIIAEYDPFHNGHAWQLAAAREMGARQIAVALSCALTQRGAPP